MKTLRLTAIATCFAAIAAGCGGDGNTPTGPSPADPPEPTIPQVAGTYQGTVEGWIDEVPLGRYPMTATVTQDGDQVTMGGEIEGGVLVAEDPITGTIDANGTVRIEKAEHESPICGTETNFVFEARFTRNSFEFENTSESIVCGKERYEGELQKTGT